MNNDTKTEQARKMREFVTNMLSGREALLYGVCDEGGLHIPDLPNAVRVRVRGALEHIQQVADSFRMAAIDLDEQVRLGMEGK